MALQIETIPSPAAAERGADFFHPAVAVLKGGLWMMTFQRIQNADCYGGAEVVFSTDEGKSWTEPAPVTALASEAIDGRFSLGVADVRPFASADGAKALVIGCDTVYSQRGAACYESEPEPTLEERGSYYTVFDALSKSFGPRRMLRNPALAGGKLWRIACAEAALAPDGDWILPAYFEHRADVEYVPGYHSPRFGVETVKVHLDGDKLIPVAWSNQLTLEVMRGLIEPSLVRRGNGYLMTIRAEDGKGYVSRSADALSWCEPAPWRFDDGTELVTESTQQHWLTAGGKLYLVYTRNNGDNAHIMRFRAPLFIAEVDETGAVPVLKKATETELFERRQRNGVDGLLGNFHVCNLADGTAIASDAYGFYKVEGDSITEHFNECAVKRVR